MLNTLENKVQLDPESKKVIEDLFKELGQTQLLTREEIKKKQQKQLEEDGIIEVKRKLLVPKVKKPSQTYLSNLNPRITKAHKLWHRLNAVERGQLCLSIGIEDDEEITSFVHATSCPDEIIDYFIINKNQPKEFTKRKQHPILIGERVKNFIKLANISSTSASPSPPLKVEETVVRIPKNMAIVPLHF